MQSSRRVAKNTGILYARMLITVFISLYATRLTLAALGAEDFGIFGLVGGAIAMLGFLNASLAGATQRFMSYAQGQGGFERVKRIFNMSVVLHLITAALMVAMLEAAGYFFFNGMLNIAENRLDISRLIYQLMVIGTLFSVLSVPYEAVITSHENMLFFALLSILESILKLLIAFYLSYSPLDHLLTYGLLMAGLPILLFFIRQIYCHRQYPECSIDISSQFDKSILRQMSSFGAWTFLGAASSMLTNYGQGIVLNIFFGASVNAAQGIASQISGQLAALSDNMLKALNPLINKSEGAGNRTLMLNATTMGSKLSFFLVMALAIPVIIEMPFILNIWLKHPPEYAIIFCRLLLIRNLVEFMFHPLVSAIYAVGNIKHYQIWNSLLTLIPLPVAYLLFQFGYPAYCIYIVFIVYAVLTALITLFIAKQNCHLSLVRFSQDVILRCVLACLLISCLSFTPHYFMDSGYQRGIATIATSGLAYLFIVFFIGFTAEEQGKVLKLLPHSKKARS